MHFSRNDFVVNYNLSVLYFRLLIRVSDDQQDVTEQNLDKALDTTKGLTFVNAIDVLEREQLYGWGRFAFTQRAVTRVRTRARRRRTKAGADHTRGHTRTPKSPPRINENLRPRRDSEVSLTEDTAGDGDDEGVFAYVWDVGLPIDDEEYTSGSDDEGFDSSIPVAYVEDSDSDAESKSNVESELPLQAQGEEDNGGEIDYSEMKEIEVKSDSDSLSVRSLPEVTNSSRPSDITSVESRERIITSSNASRIHTSSKLTKSQVPSKLRELGQTVKYAGITSVKKIQRLARSRNAAACDGYEGLTATPRPRVRSKSVDLAPKSSRKTHKRSHSNTHKRRKRHLPQRAQTVTLKRANSRIRALQRNLTTTRSAPREKLAKVLRPPKEASSSNEKESPRRNDGHTQQLEEDTRYRQLMLPVEEMVECGPQVEMSARSSTLRAPHPGNGALSPAEIAMEVQGTSTRGSRTDSLPINGPSIITVGTTFKLRSTGRPVPWKDDPGDTDIKQAAAEAAENEVSVVPEALPSFSAAKSAFERFDEPSVSAAGSTREYKSDMCGVDFDNDDVCSDVGDEVNEFASDVSAASAALEEVQLAPAAPRRNSEAQTRFAEVELTPSASVPSGHPKDFVLIVSSHQSTRELSLSAKHNNASQRTSIASSLSKRIRVPPRIRQLFRRKSHLEDGLSRRSRLSGAWPPWARWVIFSAVCFWFSCFGNNSDVCGFQCCQCLNLFCQFPSVLS